MGYSINVDIGGTFTDFFSAGDDGTRELTKSPSTHYDLSVGFMKGVRELARKRGLTLEEFLSQTDAVRYCTTVGTNALIERTGPKLGFIPRPVSRTPSSWGGAVAGRTGDRLWRTRTWPGSGSPSP